MSLFTVLGAKGFIGTHLCRYLQAKGVDVFAPERNESLVNGRNLGHLVYCIGLTADFREKPFETIDAHICTLKKFLEGATYDSFLYLSSTRIYMGCDHAEEFLPIRVEPWNGSYLYNISKLAGESLVLSLNNPACRVARLSNILGVGASEKNFIPAVLKEAVKSGYVRIQDCEKSKKDYLAVEDAVRVLADIAVSGKSRIYNVASGRNVSHREVADLVEKYTGAEVGFVSGAAISAFPVISVARITDEFEFRPLALEDYFSTLLD